MSKTKKIILYFLVVFIFLFIAILSINIYVLSFSKDPYFKHLDEVKISKHVGLVFGASVYQNSIPSGILKDRLNVAYDAYSKGLIKKIIVSGDNSKTYYNEPEVMKKYLISLGAKKDDIYLDYAGFDTYDSIYRARDVFLTNDLILFTQGFHLKRAMYISKRLGIDTIGVETNLQRYVREEYYDFREIFARTKAFIDVEILKSKPKYLGDTIEILTDEAIEKAKQGIFENN